MARHGRGFPNRPYVARTHNGDSQDVLTPTVWAAGAVQPKWRAADPGPKWRAGPPQGKWRAGTPRGG